MVLGCFGQFSLQSDEPHCDRSPFGTIHVLRLLGAHVFFCRSRDRNRPNLGQVSFWGYLPPFIAFMFSFGGERCCLAVAICCVQGVVPETSGSEVGNKFQQLGTPRHRFTAACKKAAQ